MKTNKRWFAIFKRINLENDLKVAEIGVWQGKLSRHLLSNAPKLHLTMVDRWKTYTQKEKAGDKAGTMTGYDQKIFDEAKETTIRKTEKYKLRRKIIISDSVEASKEVEDKSLDLVFIDGDHSFEGVKKDIEAWLPKVKTGGWISGHDYTRVGVHTAVQSFFKTSEIETDVDKTWFVKVK